MASSLGKTIGEPAGEPIGNLISNTSGNTLQLSAVSSDAAGQDIVATFTSLAEPGATLDTLTQTAALTSSVAGGQNLWPFLLYAMAVAALLAITLIAAWLLGAKTRHTDATDLPFESGIVPVGSAARLGAGEKRLF